jgi:hypothetical protein
VSTEIACLLTLAVAGHPWLAAIPSGWFGQLPSKLIDYRPVPPDPTLKPQTLRHLHRIRRPKEGSSVY